ncbi:TraR/DksA C4-type zinc finger protein [Candidatus Kaiserbacteria bacterium]|nr:TraR/DksA C4-type zinc finger protein [Candidatus Kaiserbacteria bacterium]
METEKFKLPLESALKAITSELSTIAKHNESSDDWEAFPVGTEVGEADSNSEADVVEEWNERRAIVAQLETRYRNIVKALTKIEEGKYGICEISGEPIEEERLMVNPAARTNLANMDREKELPV